MTFTTSFIFHQLKWGKKIKKNIKPTVKIDLCVTVHKGYSL